MINTPFKLSVVSLLFLLTMSLSAQTAFQSDIKIIQQDANGLIFEWTPRNLKLESMHINGREYQKLFFENAVSRNKDGNPALPWRIIPIGLPSEKPFSVQILSVQSRTLDQIDIAPVPVQFKDQRGISRYDYAFNDTIYQNSAVFPQALFQTSPVAYFRDLPVQSLWLTAAQYHPQSHQLTVYDRIRVRVTFAGPRQARPNRTLAHSVLEPVLRAAILNYRQAKNWAVPRPAYLKKSAQLPAGPFYKITVKEDGLYKISASLLETSGILKGDLPVDNLRLFGNGGHELHYATNASEHNPLFTQEIPILVFDTNGDQLFNGNDYLLFYGKSVDSWFYDAAHRKFGYQMHRFATENYYWLNVQPGGKGLRMGEQLLPQTPGTVDATYFMDHYHFEEDLYNLLASGPDWYGYRFFGLTGSYQKKFSLPVKTDAAGAQAVFRIQFKGGSAIHWTDTQNYRYDFKITLNTNPIFSDIAFNNSSRIKFERTITDLNWLKNGINDLSIQYFGNKDACNVYLDYFELIYPRDFSAEDDQLFFYTQSTDQDVNYRVTNLSSGNDFYILDVTDETAPFVLAKNLSSSGGQLTFTLPAADHERLILVTSLRSQKIIPVGTLPSFTPQEDLLNGSNQADYLIVTHKSFLPYAREFAQLHSQELSSKVTCMEDIYFYFNGGVPDPTALRNYIRFAYYNWQAPSPSYVLFFGDAHYDYRNINLPDTLRVPTWEIYNPTEKDSRCTDDYFVDINYTGGSRFTTFTPDIAQGRIPVESILDCERVVKKNKDYFYASEQDGWQTNLTMVADDEQRPGVSNEWLHQNDSEKIAELPNLRKFTINRVYLSLYPSVPGGFIRVKPEANTALLNYLNQGTLIVNYVGHGSPTQWAHEGVFVMERDYPRIKNQGRLAFLVAATCDFGKFDDPHEPSFTEALIWAEDRGIIGAMSSTRLAYSDANFSLVYTFFKNLFPQGNPSIPLGTAKLSAVLQSGGSSVNDQKYILFADPAMHLLDARKKIQITQIDPPDTLKALSTVTVKGEVLENNQINTNFSGEAVIIVHDAEYDSVKTGSGFNLIKLTGPRLFKGEVDVQNGAIEGHFIIPKSIRFVNKPTGRLTLYAYDPATHLNAMGYNSSLLIYGSESNINDGQGPDIDVYFKGQENFTPGDLIPQSTILIVELYDEHGINVTGETGHTISLQIDNEQPIDISGFFAYDKNSYQRGKIEYPLTQLKTGEHHFKVSAFDNLNNLSSIDVPVKVAQSSALLLEEVVNYPNPFKNNTRFTFQTNADGADVTIKIYTVTGRIIQELHGVSKVGYNDEIVWDGTDRDGDPVANGIYLYKIILREGKDKKEKIEKLVITR